MEEKYTTHKHEKIGEISGVLKEIHDDRAYVTLSDGHGNSEKVCLESDMFIKLNAWLPGTRFCLEYYETQTEHEISLTEKFHILERGKESSIPSPPVQSLKESLDKIDKRKRG